MGYVQVTSCHDLLQCNISTNENFHCKTQRNRDRYILQLKSGPVLTCVFPMYGKVLLNWFTWFYLVWDSPFFFVLRPFTSYIFVLFSRTRFSITPWYFFILLQKGRDIVSSERDRRRNNLKSFHSEISEIGNIEGSYFSQIGLTES